MSSLQRKQGERHRPLSSAVTLAGSRRRTPEPALERHAPSGGPRGNDGAAPQGSASEPARGWSLSYGPAQVCDGAEDTALVSRHKEQHFHQTTSFLERTCLCLSLKREYHFLTTTEQSESIRTQKWLSAEGQPRSSPGIPAPHSCAQKKRCGPGEPCQRPGSGRATAADAPYPANIVARLPPETSPTSIPSIMDLPPYEGEWPVTR